MLTLWCLPSAYMRTGTLRIVLFTISNLVITTTVVIAIIIAAAVVIAIIIAAIVI